MAEKKVGKKESTEKKAEEKGFLVDAAENIEAGAKVVGNKASELATDIAESTSEFAQKLAKKIKRGTEQAAETSSNIIDNLSETAQSYAEKYKDKLEISTLNKNQEELYLNLGKTVFEKNRLRNVAPGNLIKHKEIKELVDNINQNSKKIIILGKQLEQ